MGAAAGHIKHLYEDETLSFNEILDVFYNINNGSIIAYEKFDGQNLMFTIKNNVLLFARNKKQLKDPVTMDQILLMFSKHPHVKESFEISYKMIHNVVSIVGLTKLNKIFCNGSKYLNVEIVNNKSKNVIDYGDPKIIFNNICSVVIKGDYGNIINTDVLAAQDLFNEYPDIFGSNEIYPPSIVQSPNDIKLISYIEAFKSAKVFDLNQTVGTFYNISPNSTEQKRNIEYLITKIGCRLLKTIKSNKVNYDQTNQEIRDRLAQVLLQAERDSDLKNKITPHISKIQYCGGLNKFTPIEGVVFSYKNQTYKITGLFAPINQILGIVKYSR